MTRMLMLQFAIASALTILPETTGSTVTWTGWFSDKRCARAPAADERVRPNGTACVKRCLDEGSTPVFLSEQTNDIYEVRDHRGVKDDVGFRVEIVAVVDEKAKSVSVRSVKRLEAVTAMCLLPKKRGE
jgi:hypothetical protein